MIAVYTAIIGDPNLPQPRVHEGVDYICFTDQLVTSDHWDIRRVPVQGSQRLTARRYKALPHIYLRDYDYTIWVDSTIELHIEPQQLLERLKGRQMAAFKHPDRNCVYDEAAFCVELGKEKYNVAKEQVDRYRNHHYPRKVGLADTKLLIRQRSPLINVFNLFWWHEISTYSVRDQISFDYIAHRLGLIYTAMPDINLLRDNQSPLGAFKKHAFG